MCCPARVHCACFCAYSANNPFTHKHTTKNTKRLAQQELLSKTTAQNHMAAQRSKHTLKKTPAVGRWEGGGARRRAHPRSAPTSKVEPQGPPLRPMGPPRPGAEGLRQGHWFGHTDRWCAVLGGAARRRTVAVFGGPFVRYSRAFAPYANAPFVRCSKIRLTRTLRSFVVQKSALRERGVCSLLVVGILLVFPTKSNMLDYA